jgi:lipase chaperone LimK
MKEDKESITLKVTESDTIQSVKNKIEDIKRISVDSQELLFAEEKLEDQYTLSHYKITAESTLTLHNHSSSRSRCTVS